MGRGAGNDLKNAGVLQLAKRLNDITSERFFVKLARLGEEAQIELR